MHPVLMNGPFSGAVVSENAVPVQCMPPDLNIILETINCMSKLSINVSSVSLKGMGNRLFRQYMLRSMLLNLSSTSQFSHFIIFLMLQSA